MRNKEENKREMTVGLSFILCILFLLTGCSAGNSPKLVNEISFSLDGVSEVTVSYDEEEITFLESKSCLSVFPGSIFQAQQKGKNGSDSFVCSDSDSSDPYGCSQIFHK